MRILGLDWGERHLGFAVGDDETGLSIPIDSACVKNDEEAVQAIRRRLASTGARMLVVGMPLEASGRRGRTARKVEALTARLRFEHGLTVETWDERFSTQLVERSLLQANLSRRKRRCACDRLAAQVILQGYLDNIRKKETGAAEDGIATE